MVEKESLMLLLRNADAVMNACCHAVPVWDIPGYYMDEEGHLAAKKLMEADAEAAYTTALAYRLTGNAKYANKAAELLDGWASVNTTVIGHDGPLVSAYLGTGLIRAALWIQGYTGWSDVARERFVEWLRRVYLPSWEGIPGRNNWWYWSLYAQLAFHRLTGDAASFTKKTQALKEQIDSSIGPDGFIPEEAVRGKNGIWYHYFALAPATAAAKLVLNETGEDLFHWISPSGKSLKLALDTLLPYIGGREDEWPFEANQNRPNPLSSATWPVDMYEAMGVLYGDFHYERLTAPHRPVEGNRNSQSGYFLSYAWNYPTLLIRADRSEVK